MQVNQDQDILRIKQVLDNLSTEQEMIDSDQSALADSELLKQGDNEPRLNYLVRALELYLDKTGENGVLVPYDDTYCDGACLLEDFKAELGMME